MPERPTRPAARSRLDIRPDDRGLWCALGGFHIDPWRPSGVETAVISHAHADHARAGARRYIAAPDCIPLLRARLGEDAVLEPLAYGERIRLGDVEVSLHPAGHVLGSAQVRVDDGESCWAFTGDFKRAPDPSCRPFEPVRCDVLITEATFALPVYRWPAGELVARDIVAWWDRNRAEGSTSVLLCYALGKAQRILAELRRLVPERCAWLHGAMLATTAVYERLDVPMLATRAVADASEADGRADFRGELVLAPPSAAGTTWMRRLTPYRVAFASGWMRIRGNRRRRNVDTGFVLSDHADWHDLLTTAVESGARRVLATHGPTDTFCRYLREQHGLDADSLKTAYEGEGDAE